MNIKTIRMRGFLFSAVVLVLGLAGCKSDDHLESLEGNPEKTRENIVKEVDDPERVEQLLALVDTHEEKVAAIKEEVTVIREELARKNRDFNTSRSELQALYEQLYAKLDILLAAIRDDSMQMKQLCSEEEWDAIFTHRKPLFKIFN